MRYVTRLLIYAFLLVCLLIAIYSCPQLARTPVLSGGQKINYWPPHEEQKPVPQAGRSPSGFVPPVL
jgi:hypothetical protein